MALQIGFIGVGNMAGAFLKSIIESKAWPTKQIYLYDHHAEKMEPFAKKGAKVCKSSAQLTQLCDVVILAVKPQNFQNLLFEIHDYANECKTFVSIAAGISISYIKNKLCGDCPVVRAMPNMPLLIGLGATAVCKSENVNEEIFKTICMLFSCCGKTVEISENQMDAIVSVSGSSPAYIYLLAKAVIDFAVSQGINSETAKELFCQTLKGSAEMILRSDVTLDSMINSVCSKGGTTIAAMEVFEKSGTEKIFKDAMTACMRRSAELGK